jgi:hypothetical protein
MINIYRDLIDNSTIVLCNSHATMAGNNVDYIAPAYILQCEICADAFGSFIVVIHHCVFYNAAPTKDDPVYKIYPYDASCTSAQFQDKISTECKKLNQAEQTKPLAERRYYYYRIWQHCHIDM